MRKFLSWRNDKHKNTFQTSLTSRNLIPLISLFVLLMEDDKEKKLSLICFMAQLVDTSAKPASVEKCLHTQTLRNFRRFIYTSIPTVTFTVTCGHCSRFLIHRIPHPLIFQMFYFSVSRGKNHEFQRKLHSFEMFLLTFYNHGGCVNMTEL